MYIEQLYLDLAYTKVHRTPYTVLFIPYIDHVQLYIDLACPQVHRTLYTLHCSLNMFIEQFYLDLACPQVIWLFGELFSRPQLGVY